MYQPVPDEAPVVTHSPAIQQERTAAAKKLDNYQRGWLLSLHGVPDALKLKPAESINRLVNSNIDIPLKTAADLQIYLLEDAKRKAEKATTPPVQDTPPVSPRPTIQPTSPLPESIMSLENNNHENLTLLSDVSSEQQEDNSIVPFNQNVSELDNTLKELLAYCKAQKEEIEGLNMIVDQLQQKNINQSYMLDSKNEEVKILFRTHNELNKQVNQLTKEKTQLKSKLQWTESMYQTSVQQILMMQQQQQQQQRLQPGTYRWVVYQQPQPQGSHGGREPTGAGA